MLKVLVRAAAVAAFVVVAAIPVTASAAGGGGGGGTSNGMTVTIGSPIKLQNKLLVTVPVTVTCVAPISVDPRFTQPGSVGVTVEEAVGKAIASGSGGVELDSCSPTPQTFFVQVTPNLFPASGPFKKGAAIANATGVICDSNFPQTCYLGGTGWLTIRLG